MERRLRWETIIVVIVLSVSLVLRLSGLSAFRVADEMRWICRVIGFRDALARGDWADTYRTHHPGMVTTWLGAVFSPAEPLQVRTMCAATRDGVKLAEYGVPPTERHELLATLNGVLFRARIGVALFSWVSIAGIYILTRMLWGARVAVLSLVLIALDPFYLALSRFLHVDAVLTSAMTLSILSLLISLSPAPPEGRRLAFLLLSGATGGLSILQKSPAMFLGPFMVLVQVAGAVREGGRRETLLRAGRNVLVWGLVAVVVYVGLWPTMWVDPLGTMRQVLGSAVEYAAEGHSTGNYFLGRPTEDPGWLFYPVALAFRSSPLVLIGLGLGLLWVTRKGTDSRQRFLVGVLLGYSVLFGAFMSLGAKMFDRYLLPVFPPLEILAAMGLLWGTEVASKRWGAIARHGRGWARSGIYLLAFSVQAALVLPHHPHYLTYYNPLLGGGRLAKEVLLMGWGEGYEEVAAYLNAKPGAERLEVAMSAFPTFAPLFRGETRPTGQYTDWNTDYVVFYLSYVQRKQYGELEAEYLNSPSVEPEYVANLHGVDYAWLYRNEHYVEPVRYLEEHGRPDQGECLLVNGESLFAEHYGGELPVYAFSSEWIVEDGSYTYQSADEVAGLLDGMSGCERVWYAAYPVSEPKSYLDLLSVRGLLLKRSGFPHMELTLRRLVEVEALVEPTNLRFGGLRLVGYGVTDQPPGWGRDGGVALAWEAAEQVDEDYSVFLHVYDGRGERVALGDALLVDRGLRPTSHWEEGARSTVLYHLPIGPGTPPGQYELELGVYNWKTGKRLRLADEGGQTTAVRLKMEVGRAEGTPTLGELGVEHAVNREVIPELQLAGYDFDREGVLTGQTVTMRIYWQAIREMEQDYRLAIRLRGADGREYGGGEYDLLDKEYATTMWRPGEVLRGVYELSVSEDAPTGELEVEVNLLGAQGRRVLAEPAAVGEVWAQSMVPSFEAPDGMGGRAVSFGGQITLLGWEIEEQTKAGGNVYVTLYWQAGHELDTNYKVFVHVYDQQGDIVAQRDWLPGLGAKPTVDWEPGEVVADRHVVALGNEARPGKYPVAVGLYEEGSGERLACFGPDGERLTQDRVFLGEVEAKP